MPRLRALRQLPSSRLVEQDNAFNHAAGSGAAGASENANNGGTGDGGNAINWDFGDAPPTASSARPDAAASDAGGIDWGAISCDGVELAIEEGEAADQAPNAANNWLVDQHVRELLIQDIAEVGAFLQARCAEMASSAVGEHQGPQAVQKSIKGYVHY